MMQTIGRVAVLVLVAGVLVGCPGPSIQTPGDATETASAEAVELARANYQFFLEALRDRMKVGGDIRKQVWAERELENLADAHTLRWDGLGEIVPPDASSLADANEALLVEYVVGARRGYLKAIDDLLAIYQSTQDERKIRRVEAVLNAFNPVYTYLYYLTAEVPGPTLRAIKAQLAATDLFNEAMKPYQAAEKRLGMGEGARLNYIEAIGKFRQVVEKYPESDRIARCAFHIAEINRHFGEYDRAAMWYDRAWQWNPQTPNPVRYRAATMYDFKLKSPAKALEYYRLTLEFETDFDNRAYAEKRIKMLGPK